MIIPPIFVIEHQFLTYFHTSRLEMIGEIPRRLFATNLFNPQQSHACVGHFKDLWLLDWRTEKSEQLSSKITKHLPYTTPILTLYPSPQIMRAPDFYLGTQMGLLLDGMWPMTTRQGPR